MTACCRRNSATGYTSINATESKNSKSVQCGRKFEYLCGGPFPRLRGNIPWQLTIVAVFTACSVVFPLLIFNPHQENALESSDEDRNGIIGICLAGAVVGMITIGSLVSEAHAFCDMRTKRWAPSPCTLFTAALVACIALTAFYDHEAKHVINETATVNAWVNETLKILENNCTGTVLVKKTAMTSDNCTRCEEDQYVNHFPGPFQSILLPHVNVTFCNVSFPFCGLKLDWFHDVNANWSAPGNPYLCGTDSMTTTGQTSTSSTTWWQNACILSYLAADLKLFPPMIMKYIQVDDNCGNFQGFATEHRSLLARCYPNAVFNKSCDSHYGNVFFEEVQLSLDFIQNKTVPAPKRAEQVVKLANNPAIFLGSRIALGVSMIYETGGFLLRNFALKNPR